MVTAYRARLGESPFMAPYSNHPGGTPNPRYGAASKPRSDRMHAAFTKSAILHVTVWTRAQVDHPGW